MADKEEGGILTNAQTCDNKYPGSLTAVCSSDELVKHRGRGIPLEAAVELQVWGGRCWKY